MSGCKRCGGECRFPIDYEEDDNCALVTIDKNPGGMTNEEISKRFGVTPQRIGQIINRSLEKLAGGAFYERD